ncbi:MAG TPA: hypothetical protein VGV89_01970 [Thermoplasmata archaeon]|nr:hypothetical protein [Thermoplasmata archaeon]
MKDPSGSRAATSPNSPSASTGVLRSAARRAMLPGIVALALLVAVPTLAFASPAPGLAAPHLALPAPGSGLARGPVGAPLGASHGLSAVPSLGSDRIVPSAALRGSSTLPAGMLRQAVALSSAHAADPRPQVGPNENNLAASFGLETGIATTGKSSLADVLESIYPIANGTAPPSWTGTGLTPSASYFQDGLEQVVTSTDNGSSWSGSPALLPINTSWAAPSTGCTSTSPLSCGSVNEGPATIASNSAGDVVVATEYSQPCFYLGLPFAACNSTAAVNINASTGVSISFSSDGGATFTHTSMLSAYQPVAWIDYTSSTCGPLAIYLNGNYTFNYPKVSLDPSSGHGFVTWTEAYNNYANNITCNTTAQAWEYVSTYTGYVYTWISTTSNGGLTWTNPVLENDVQTGFSGGAIGPASSGRTTQYAFTEDFTHGSSSTGIPIAMTTSTNNGSTWSKLTDLRTSIGTVDSFFVRGIPATDGIMPSHNELQAAADPTPGSSNVYLVWGDNRSFSSSGGDPSVAFAASSNGGTLWNTSYITPDSPSNWLYLEPEITVDSTGAVWVSFYGYNISNTPTTVVSEMMVSYDQGGTWFGPFVTASQPSMLGAATANSFQAPIGSSAGLTSDAYGTIPAWVDCRTIYCNSAGATINFYEHDIYTAIYHTVSASSNVSSVTIQASVSESTPFSLALPAIVPMEVGGPVTLSAPSTEPLNATTVYAFSGWSGAIASAANPASGNYFGATNSLRATYTPQPGASIVGKVTPNIPGLQVTVDGNAVTLFTSGNSATYSWTIATGTIHTIVAKVTGTYANYWQQNTSQVNPRAYSTNYVNYTLAKTGGWVAGSVNLKTASVTLNGTPISVDPTGHFNVSRLWGTYWVEGTLNGYVSYGPTLLTVSPGRTATAAVVLNGGSITGSVAFTSAPRTNPPLTANVSINGVPQSVNSLRFSLGSLANGTYTVTSDAPGYSWFSKTVTVVAGTPAVNVQVNLTNEGWIVGTVSPASALLQVNGNYITNVDHTTGAFNVTERATTAKYEIEALASGYNTTYANVTLTPGNASAPITLTLQKAVQQQNCTVTNTCVNNNKPDGGNNGNNNLLLYAAIGAVIAVVAAIAIVMLLRRRGGSGPAEDTGAAPAPEGGTAAQQPWQEESYDSGGSSGGGTQ